MGGGGGALEEQVEKSLVTSSSRIIGCTSPQAAGMLRATQPIMLMAMPLIGQCSVFVKPLDPGSFDAHYNSVKE